MLKKSIILKSLLKRKLVTTILVTISLAAFASLGDGGKKDKANPTSLSSLSAKNFSLRSGYHFKSDNILNSASPKRFIMLNTVVTYQRGNATYILPLRKKVLLDKVIFNPSRPKF
jgi:hypothetical protein